MKTYNCCCSSSKQNNEIKAKKSENNLAQVLEKNRADLNSAGYEKKWGNK